MHHRRVSTRKCCKTTRFFLALGSDVLEASVVEGQMIRTLIEYQLRCQLRVSNKSIFQQLTADEFSTCDPGSLNGHVGIHVISKF